MNEDFYKNEYFKQLDNRLASIEDKVDKLTAKVVWIYASASVIGAIVSVGVNIAIHYIK